MGNYEKEVLRDRWDRFPDQLYLRLGKEESGAQIHALEAEKFEKKHSLCHRAMPERKSDDRQ